MTGEVSQIRVFAVSRVSFQAGWAALTRINLSQKSTQSPTGTPSVQVATPVSIKTG